MPMYCICQVHDESCQTCKKWLTFFAKQRVRAKEESRGCVLCDQAAVGGVRAGAAGSRPGCPVTESYISQLLTGKRAPPAPNRTDIYDKMDKFLKLPSGELAKLADHQRKEQLKREL